MPVPRAKAVPEPMQNVSGRQYLMKDFKLPGEIPVSSQPAIL
jgi:hypothetical protein